MASLMQCLLAMSLTASLISIRLILAEEVSGLRVQDTVSAQLCPILWIRADVFSSNLEISTSFCVAPCGHNPHLPRMTEN